MQNYNEKMVLAIEIREQFTVGLLVIVSGYEQGSFTILLKKELFTGGSEITKSMIESFMEEIRCSLNIKMNNSVVSIVVPGSWEYKFKKCVRNICKNWGSTPILIRVNTALRCKLLNEVNCFAIWYTNARFGEISVYKLKNETIREIAWLPYHHSGIPFMDKFEWNRIKSLLDEPDSFCHITNDEINIEHIFICGDITSENILINQLKEKYGNTISLIPERLIIAGATHVSEYYNQKSKLELKKVRWGYEIMTQYESRAHSI